MTRIITYSLKADAANSDEYYRAVTAFASAWLEESRALTADLVSGFRAFRASRGEADRSEAEYQFELLALGVTLREHGAEAGRTPGWIQKLSRRLVEVQTRFPRWEGTVKAARGWVGWMARRMEVQRGDDTLGQLLTWLAANDESTKEARFAEWRAFFQSLGEGFTHEALTICLRLADDFAADSAGALGKFTAQVEHFLADEAPKYRRRYDARLLSRTRVEYHLGMLGTEILSRAFRERFLAAKHKVVIVPPCMSAPAEKCKAIDTPLGAKCQACTPTCRVHQITKLGEKRGFSVTMIPDDVKVFGSGGSMGSVGLVGVACALTNWGGGWDAQNADIPAQGVLLDFVGCKTHWDKQGIPTDVNLKRLQEVLGV